MLSSLLATLLLAGLLYGRLPSPLLIFLLFALPPGFFLLRLHHGRHHRHSHSLLRLDLLAQGSRLADWNAGLKLFAVIALLLLAIGADSLALAVWIMLGMTALNLAASRMNPGAYLSLLAAPITFVATGGLVLLADLSPAPLGYLDIPLLSGYISITPEGQKAAALITAKAMAGLGCLYGLSLSTPVYEITSLLRRIRVPAVAVELMILIYRYLFLLLESLRSMSTAADARLGYRTYRASWRSFGGIGGNLLVRAFLRASRSFDAMEARGYDGEIRFLENPKPVRASHAAAALLLLAVSAAPLLLLQKGGVL